MTWRIESITHDATYALRQKILWPEKTIEQVKVAGDESALHLGAFIQDRQIGIISLFSDGESMQFRKLAVLQEFLGIGVGRALICACISLAARQGASMLWCDARQEALGFYEKLGFTIDSQVFIKSGKTYQKAFMPIAAA